VASSVSKSSLDRISLQEYTPSALNLVSGVMSLGYIAVPIGVVSCFIIFIVLVSLFFSASTEKVFRVAQGVNIKRPVVR